MMSREERTLQKEKEEQEVREKEKKKKQKKKIMIGIVGAILAIFALLYYSRFIATSGLVVREYKVENSKLPASFYGLKIVQFSDLHYGSTIDNAYLQNLVKKINELRPDILVFTGDLIDKDTNVTEEVTNEVKTALSQMEAKIGKYAVSGNHDYLYDGFRQIIEEGGFQYLDNTYDLIYYQGYDPILITGMSDSGQYQNDIDQAFSYFKQEDSKKNIFTISLFHEPDDITSILAKYNVDLALAGHSHNGQVRIPFLPPIVTVKGAKKYNEPYYRVKDTDLYISGGLGTSNFKFRLFNRPSINLFRVVNQ